MSWLNKAGQTMDSLVGIVSPKKAAARRYYRSAGQRYAAARPGRISGPIPRHQLINDLVQREAAPIKARVRQLVQDFPYFARAVNALVALRVGPGHHLRPQILTADGKPDRQANRQVEQAWAEFVAEADITGRQNLHGLVSLAAREEIESGECLLMEVLDKDKSRFSPLAFQLLDSSWLGSLHGKAEGKNEIFNGVEFDPATGRPLAYHLSNPANYGNSVRLPADQVLHVFKILQAGQLRGVSPFAVAVLAAISLNEMLGAELDAAAMASQYLAFVTSGDPAQFQTYRTSTDPDTGQRIEDLEHALIEYLQPGQNIEFARPNRPGDTFSPFVELVLRMISVGTGISYSLVTGDYQKLQYTVARVERNDLKMINRSEQLRSVSVYDWVYPRFMDWSHMAGRLRLPGYWTRRIACQRHSFLPPGLDSLDPLRETKAWAQQVREGFRSRREIAAGLGRDLEDVYAESAEDDALAKEYGLTLGGSSTSGANNPAALGAQE